MVRTQIQLTEEQAREIKRVAVAKGVSVAKIIRGSVEGIIKVISKNVIPAKAGIQNSLTSLDSRLRGSDKLIIIRGSLKSSAKNDTEERHRRALEVVGKFRSGKRDVPTWRKTFNIRT